MSPPSSCARLPTLLPSVAPVKMLATACTKILRDAGWWQFEHRKLRLFIKIPLDRTEHVGGVEPMAAFIANQATDFLRT